MNLLLGPLSRLLKSLLAGLAFWRWGKVSAERDAAVDAGERAEKGRKAAGEADAKLKAGKTPEQIVRENDAKW